MERAVSSEIKQLREWVDSARRVVFFGGAGVSTESGIPDFRSVDGLYNQKYDYPPETILSRSFFHSKSAAFYRFYRDKMVFDPTVIRPNAAHAALARLEAEGKMQDTGIVTQNIDGLHTEAGSKRVFELHGSIHRNFCTRCRRFYPLSRITDSENDPGGVPLCTCGGIIKPDVVLYGEPLDEATVEGAVNAIAAADLLIIGGTSMTVYPAAGLVRYFRGNRTVIINRDATAADGDADLIIREPIGTALGSLFD
ncbi:MAG: NAD-dependent protein deacylase [Clostridia bacterium]|nr:NAD-dependent protein deacylase [Clostridia bacterium]